MATYFSILAWRTPWTEEPGEPWGHKESVITEHIITEIGFSKYFIPQWQGKKKSVIG